MADTKLLLSIDSGGIRGIIPICMLMKLEEATGKPARDTFDFVAATQRLPITKDSTQAPHRVIVNAPPCHPERSRRIAAWLLASKDPDRAPILRPPTVDSEVVRNTRGGPQERPI